MCAIIAFVVRKDAVLPSKQKLSALIHSCYEAGMSAEKWPNFLELLSAETKGAHAAILFNDYSNERFLVGGTYNMDPGVQPLYTGYYAKLDEHYISGKNVLRTGWCGVGQSLVADERLLKSEYYNDYLRKFDMFNLAVSALKIDCHGFSALSLLRSRRKGPFRVADIDLLEFLTPHLQSALAIHQQMVELKGSSRDFQAALDLFERGVILVDAKHRILFMNKAASGLIAKGDGLIATRESLIAENPTERPTLRRLIDAAIAVTAGAGIGQSGSMFISRKFKKPLRALVSATCRTDHWGSGNAFAVLFIADPAAQSRPRAAALMESFRLTPAECRIALLVADAFSLREISDTLGISPNTIKTHLGNIYSKTGTKRQSQLVRVLLSLSGE